MMSSIVAAEQAHPQVLLLPTTGSAGTMLLPLIVVVVIVCASAAAGCCGSKALSVPPMPVVSVNVGTGVVASDGDAAGIDSDIVATSLLAFAIATAITAVLPVVTELRGSVTMFTMFTCL